MQTYFLRRGNINALWEPRGRTDHLLWHHAAHTVDLLRHQTGQEIVEAHATAGPGHPELGTAMDMSVLLHTAGNVICSLSSRFYNDGPPGSVFHHIGDTGTYLAFYEASISSPCPLRQPAKPPEFDGRDGRVRPKQTHSPHGSSWPLTTFQLPVPAHEGTCWEALMMSIFAIRPSGATAEKYRAAGVWRDTEPIGDLRRWRLESPDAIAIRAYRAGTVGAEMCSVELSYADYAHYVERFAGALYELGVRPGQVVAFQLPNWWQSGALLLAAMRLRAVLAPIMTTIGPRELERMLARVGANVCVTADEWDGFHHAAALREMAPRLPELRHRVVIGSAEDGETEFGPFFEDTPWERRHPVALDDASEDPDRVAILFFTSGTSGEPKGALHSHNTVHAGIAGLGEPGVGQQDVIFTPHALMHTLAYRSTLLSLWNGACRVLLDSWSGERGATILTETGTTIMLAAPTFIQDVIATRDGELQRLPALRALICTGTTIPQPLVSQARRILGVSLQAGWGMTETGLITLTRGDDPPGWASHSDGRPRKGVEIDLRSDTDITRERPGHAFVRSGGVCLATVGRDTGKVVVSAEQDDGWYDTGDLAAPDGRGGFKLMGRATDRIGGVFMIPVNDVESALLGHPGVADVALVGYPSDDGGELACAVITPTTTPPITLDELREYLSAQGMTKSYLPSRLESVETLPRNSNGKVRKELLRRWLRGQAALTE